LIVIDVLYKLLQAWLFVPAVALLLGAALARAGRVAVSNRDILDFVLSPPGLLWAAVAAIAGVTLLLGELAGLMGIVAVVDAGHRPGLWRVLGSATRNVRGIAQLGAIVTVLLGLTLAPFGLLAVLTYGLLLTEQDIYFYVQDRPPAFWAAVSIGVVLVLAALAAGLTLSIRWALALPIVLFERARAVAALRASRERTQGARLRIGILLVGWPLVVWLVGLGLEAGFLRGATAALTGAGERPLFLILALLIAQGALLATVAFALVVGQALLIRRLYLERSAALGLPLAPPADTGPSRSSPWPRRLAYASLALILLAPLALWADLSRYLTERRPVQVTAHRGHARAAPENTLSALRRAIASGADYAEIDVHHTADGVIVLLHDRDLKRVAGDPRRLADVPYAEVRQMDVGSWFDPAFAGERIPTLAEAIEVARGRIKLHIELKFFGPDQRLAGDVARFIRAEDFEADCLIASFRYDALQHARQVNPRLRTALTVAHALGDASRFDVDVLSIRADHLSDALLRQAHDRGREVHVWTVNDPRQMLRLMQRGVDNILTSDPDLLIRVRDDWTARTDGERLLLAARSLLGVDPFAGR
jgi:glycerophosphoryl diester phosphodiesterase